ncbi:unnamed protein product [Rotaria socialis]|uniref:Uncharacterized protein n=1 Tax=Rotaria socialis TaxID=392032 RepID=A0A820AUS0_9BILA|nr:unnamed protein product [Rotaria socialis]CAF3381411.1 unnamed protein product [Rotaria socialis]CAF3537604.1 unnamed protein product [Rotaria socialis]CAF4188818.1 unnamed protein product [Rotaria socialis]CAF4355029.1 unnamed protein product [Rotaria socialis]
MVAIKEKLKIEIVEHNNEVLPILIRDIGVNLRSGEDVALVRFDSYADLLAPKDVKADEIGTLNHLVDSITNQSWILPAVYRGYITKIFWFKPPWAHQFQDGKYPLQVGKCQQTGVLKVTSTNPYFTSNCVYASMDKLSNMHTVDVYVSTTGLAKNYSTIIEKSHPSIYDNESGSESLDADNRKKPKLSNDNNHEDSSTVQRVYPLDATLIDQLLETRQFIMDINLSFFSTDDYIRKQLDENEYEILRYVYTRIVQDRTDTEIQRYITARESALEQIRTCMDEYLTEPKLDQPILIDNPYLSALISIIRLKKLDWKLIHSYGMHLSDTRPPLHVSSEEMVIYLHEAMAKVLQSIKKNPILITISRCVDDGYCSSDQADLIQRYVEKKLRKLYKIDETVGKSLLTNDDNDDEFDEDVIKDRKSLVISDDENSGLSTNGRTNRPLLKNEKSLTNETTSSGKHISLHNDNNAALSPSISTHSRHLSSLSIPSPTKGNSSPGELTKAMSPSSLSEASPILD